MQVGTLLTSRHQLVPVQPVCVPMVQAPKQVLEFEQAVAPGQVTAVTPGHAEPSPAQTAGALYMPAAHSEPWHCVPAP